jgi:hypothetical protein
VYALFRGGAFDGSVLDVVDDHEERLQFPPSVDGRRPRLVYRRSHPTQVATVNGRTLVVYEYAGHVDESGTVTPGSTRAR